MEQTITLTAGQRENLIKFMQRVELKGFEVPEYVELVAVLNKPILDKMAEQNEAETKKEEVEKNE